jgi:beta-lactam-binding protein with PASTA domain
VAYQHVREDPVPPSEINADVTPDINAIVLKAMAKNPVNRYQSAGEMRNDLLRAAAGRPVAATPVYSPEERTQIVGPGVRQGGTGAIPTGPVDPPRRRRGLVWVLALAGLIGIFALAAWGATHLLGGKKSDTVPVPQVLGQPIEAAKSALRAKGFKAIAVVPVPSDAAKQGQVITQSPSAGTEVETSTQITLDVGAGPDKATVPNLDGQNKEGAVNSLKEAKLTPHFTYTASEKPKDRVLDWNHKDESVAVNTVIEVTLSDGSLKLVPGVVGLTRELAETKLRAAGFRVETSQTESTEPAGKVLEQNPGEGQKLPANTLIRIVVAKAPPEQPTTPPPTSDSPSPTTSPTESPSTSGTPTVPPTP